MSERSNEFQSQPERFQKPEEGNNNCLLLGHSKFCLKERSKTMVLLLDYSQCPVSIQTFHSTAEAAVAGAEREKLEDIIIIRGTAFGIERQE